MCRRIQSSTLAARARVEKAQRLRAEGLSIDTIATRLGVLPRQVFVYLAAPPEGPVNPTRNRRNHP